MCSILIFDERGHPVSDEALVQANAAQQRRGPDHTEVVRRDDMIFVHNLLHMTGQRTIQPFTSRDVVALFNGEIYNYKQLIPQAKSDGEVLLPLYRDHGLGFISAIEEEAAICIVDFHLNTAMLITDPFATKPLYYSTSDERFAAASYASALTKLGKTGIQKVGPGQVMLFRLRSAELVGTWRRWKFDVANQTVDSYEPWVEAFKASIAKRSADLVQKIFLGLSGGYDSGLIAAALQDRETPFHAFTILAQENPAVVLERHTMLDPADSTIIDLTKVEFSEQAALLRRDCEPFTCMIPTPHNYRARPYHMLDDKGSVGLGVICARAKAAGLRIYMSGQGADEVISDYGRDGHRIYDHSTLQGTFPKDLEAVFPWSNFYGGTQQAYIAKEDQVSGMYGLEGRYPFLDRDVVQAFLNLTPAMKNAKYKGPIAAALDQLDWPYTPDEKVGFSCNKNLR